MNIQLWLLFIFAIMLPFKVICAETLYIKYFNYLDISDNKIKFEIELSKGAFISYIIYNIDDKENEGSYYITGEHQKYTQEVLGLKSGTNYVLKFSARSNNNSVKENYFFRTLGIPPLRTSVKINSQPPDKINIELSSNKICEYNLTLYLNKKTVFFESDTITGKRNILVNNLKSNKEYNLEIIFTSEGNETKVIKKKIKLDFENIALRKKVFGTFNKIGAGMKRDYPWNLLKRITDGDYYASTGMASSGNVSEKDQFFIIDLEHIYRITRIELYWRRIAAPSEFRIAFTDNENKFYEIDKTFDAANGYLKRSSGGNMLVNVIKMKNRIARYIKVTIPKDSKIYRRDPKRNYIQIMEAKVFGEFIE